MVNSVRVSTNMEIRGSLAMTKDGPDFPENPGLCTLWPKDGTLYVYMSVGGLTTWYPLVKASRTYLHTQGEAALTWTVKHDLNSPDTWYQVQDSSGNIVSVERTITNDNQFVLNFTEAVTGMCIVVAPDDLSVPAVKAAMINIGNGTVIMNSSGITINGSPVLTAESAGQGVTTTEHITNWTGLPYDLALSTSGKPSVSEKVLRFKTPRAYKISNVQTGASAVAQAAATAASVFTIAKNGTQIGTITFSAGSATGTISIPSATNFAVGDLLTITAPATQDTTLTDLDITLLATLTA